MTVRSRHSRLVENINRSSARQLQLQPYLSHVTADPIYRPHPPRPMSPPSTGTSSISSPPPTTSRLNVNSTAFTPPRPLKKADSTEVNIENLKPSSSLTSNTSTDVQVSVSRRGSPGTANPSGEEGVARAKAVEQFAKAEQLTEEPMVDTIRRDPGSLPQDIKGSPYTSKMEPKKRAVLLDQPNPSHAPVPLPSALATARNIDVLSRVQPNPALGANARDGKFQYRASSTLPPRQGSTAMSFDAPSAFSKSTTPNPFGSGRMGQFTTSGAKLMSQERLHLTENSHLVRLWAC